MAFRSFFTQEQLDKLRNLKLKRHEIEQKRERNINRYILPLEDQLEKIRKKIDDIEII
jgi:hypothetical protein